MSKERYEYERQQLEYIKEWFNKQEDAPYMEITYEYFISLIEWAEERLRLLKRVQEMEDKSIKHEARINNLTFDLAVSRAQNKRYREALDIMLYHADNEEIIRDVYETFVGEITEESK